MTLALKNHFHCDFFDPETGALCPVKFEYAPINGPEALAQLPQELIDKLAACVTVVNPLTGYTTFFCSPKCAVEAIQLGQHHQKAGGKITGATAADFERAKQGMKVVQNMRTGQKPS